MTHELEGKHIAVSGGTGALGRDVVQLLLERGAHCWVPCFEPAPSQELVAEYGWQAHDRVHTSGELDLSIPEVVASFYAQMPSLWASVHVAGGFAMAKIANTSLADFERMWRMNTVSTFLCCKAAVAKIREQGDPSKVGGRIVNVAARPAVEPTGSMLAYSTSKAGVASITECLAREVADEGILVNALLPAIMDTPGNRAAMPKADHSSWPKTSEIAQTIAFLVSPANAVTTGALVPVYGKLV